jgi:hypothetical protein
VNIASTRHAFVRLFAPSVETSGGAAGSTGFALSRVDLRLLMTLCVASRLVIGVVIALSYFANTSRLESGLDDLFCNWDCDWYVGIAENGYQHLNEVGASGAANWAFFPLLPLLMWAISHITGLSAVFSGLFVAQIGWGLGLYLLFLLARDMRGVDFARHVAIVYAAWPFAIHSSIPMTEAVFVPLSIGVLLFARRGDWLLAAGMAALLSATRTVGVLAVLPMLMLAAGEFGLWRVVLLRPGTERAAIALGAAGLGIGLYMIHLYGLTGDALAFSHNQVAWSRKFELPWMMVIDELNPAYISPQWLLANVLDIGSGLAAFALLAYLWRRGVRPEALFAAVTLLIAFDSGNASSLPRYAGGLFPVMLAVALLCEGPLARAPAYALLIAGTVSLTFAWSMEQFYVM